MLPNGYSIKLMPNDLTLYPIDYYISHHSFRYLLFEIDDEKHSDPQLYKFQTISDCRMFRPKGTICPENPSQGLGVIAGEGAV